MRTENKSISTNLFSWLSVLLLGVLLFVGYFHTISAITQDLGRHILTGNIILENKVIPSINLFSYTHPSFPFINHHYLPEIIFAVIYNHFSYNGLMILSLLLVFTASLLVFKTSQKNAHTLAVIFSSALFLRILFERTDIRPELFSFLFLSIFVFILFKNYAKKTNLLFVLPFISVLWVNSHIYFPIGIGILGLFFIDNLIKTKGDVSNKKNVSLFLTLILCLIATLLNPHFLQGAFYPFTVFSNYGYTIEENQTPFFLASLGFYKSSFTYLLLTLASLIICMIISFKKIRLIDILLIISFTMISFAAVRNFPLFVFAILPTFSYLLTQTIVKIISLFPQLHLKKLPLYSLRLLILFILLFQILHISSLKTLEAKPDTGATPGVNFFIQNKLEGPLFNNFDIGSYLIFRLYPKEKVFIDGRPEAYPADFIQEVYIPLQEDPELFKTYDKKYAFNTIFFSHTDMTPWAQKFLQDIIQNPSWKTVYLDPYVIILVKDVKKNAAIIKRFAQPHDNLRMTSLHNGGKKDILRALNFFVLTADVQNQVHLVEKLLAIDPQNCDALQFLAQYNATSSSFFNMYEKRYREDCL